MLDSGQETRIRYFLENILEDAGMEPETARPIIQALWTKGYRGSTEDAQAFLKEKLEEGVIDDEVRKAMAQIVKKYSRWR